MYLIDQESETLHVECLIQLAIIIYSEFADRLQE